MVLVDYQQAQNLAYECTPINYTKGTALTSYSETVKIQTVYLNFKIRKVFSDIIQKMVILRLGK